MKVGDKIKERLHAINNLPTTLRKESSVGTYYDKTTSEIQKSPPVPLGTQSKGSSYE